MTVAERDDAAAAVEAVEEEVGVADVPAAGVASGGGGVDFSLEDVATVLAVAVTVLAEEEERRGLLGLVTAVVVVDAVVTVTIAFDVRFPAEAVQPNPSESDVNA